MAVRSLDDILIDQLRDPLSAEKQITKALPNMAKAASTLPKAFHPPPRR